MGLTIIQIELEFGNFGVFEEGGKPENPEKTWATLVGGECFQHCAIHLFCVYIIKFCYCFLSVIRFSV